MASFIHNHVILDEIIDRVSNGETLTRVCKFDEGGYERGPGEFPKVGSVLQWTLEASPIYNAEFTVRYAVARIAQQHVWILESKDIADTPEIGEETTEETVDMDGEKPYTKTVTRTLKKDMTAHRQMQISTRHRAAAMSNPDLWAAKARSASGLDDDDGEVTVHGGLPD